MPEYSDAKDKNGKWQHLVDYCLELYDEIKKSEYRSKTIELIHESVEAYNQEEQHTTDPWEGASNIILPLTTISNDNLEPRLVSGLVGKRPYIRFEMESEQPQDPPTEMMQTWFDQELQDNVRVESVAEDIVHRFLQDGTVYPMAKYDYDEVTRRDFVFVNQDVSQMPGLVELAEAGAIIPHGGVFVDAETGEPIHREVTDSVFEGGKVELIPFEDVFIPDDADEWEKTPVIRHVYPTYAELERSKDQPGYMNVDKDLLRDTQGHLSEGERSAQQELDGVKVTGKEVVKCIECCVSYIYQSEDQEKEDITNWTEERLVAQIALDRKILIRLLPLREINWKNEHLIKRVRLFPEKGKAYGTPLYGKIKNIQKGASKVFNSAINIAEVVMIPWFMYSDKVGFKNQELKLTPGMGIPCDDPSGVVFPRFNINPSQIFDFFSIWMSMWERLVSIGDLQVGRESESGTTATEVLAVIQEGNVKHNYQARKPREEFISVIRTIYDLYYQNMPLEKTFLYNGQQTPIPRQEMSRPYQFKLTASTEQSNKLIERKEKESFWALATNDPHGVFDPIWAAKELVKSYGVTDVDQAINPMMLQITQAIREIPGAAQLFQESLQQATQMAQQIEQEGKQMGQNAAVGAAALGQMQGQ